MSFVGHAAGVNALYSPAVQTRYIELEGKYLASLSEPLENPAFDLKKIPEVDFVVEFLSYLRLHNTSEMICLRQDVKCADTSWKFFETKAECDGWVRTNNVNEKYYNRGQRNEQVYLGRSYWATYIELINDLTNDEKAFLLKTRVNVMKLKSNSITDTYLTLWYLLFGCEVIKNPAALIHHNMALDLIEAEQLNWEDLAENAPMLGGGAIQKAMALNEHYAKFMPHPYSYQTTYNFPRKDLLVGREAEITKKWLKLKCVEVEYTEQDIAAEKIWSLIMESFENWGLDAVKQSLGGKS